MANEPIKENSPSEGITAQPGDTQQTSTTLPGGAQEAITTQPAAVKKEGKAEESGGIATAPAESAPVKSIKAPTYAGFDRLLAFLLLVLVFFLGSFAVTHSDVLMNLATGRSIAQGEYQFGVDPYSFATQAHGDRPAKTWVNHSWFYSLLLYHLFTAVGETGLVICHALLGVGLTLVLLLTRDRRCPLLVHVFFVGLGMLALSSQFFLRPAAVSMLLLGLTIHFLYRAGVLGGIEPERVRPRLLWGVPILCLFWVNLDAWFLLGPLVLGLVWAGSWLNEMFGGEKRVPGKELGLVFLVSLLACLVNPHTIRAFMLPPELSYLLVRIGVQVPEWLGAGGHTLQQLQLQQAQSNQAPLWFLVSPMAGTYLGNVNQGGNVAGWSFFALLLMGLLTFLLKALAIQQDGKGQDGKRQDGKGGLDFTRLAPWAVLALLGLSQSALVPWVSILGSVVTALNLGEFLRQRQEAAKKEMTGTTEPGLARLGRLVTFLLVLIALAMAWPGWLHASLGNFSSSRRVTWTFRHDPTAASLAQRLGDLHREGKVEKVFNFQWALADYFAWYAPGVRCFLDSRHHLFPDLVKVHADWRKALWEEGARVFSWEILDTTVPPGSVWRKGFLDYGVDHLAFLRDPFAPVLLQKFWLQPHEWTLRFGEGQAALFAWAGPEGMKPGDDFVEARAREVFLGMPAERRPPAGGFVPAPLPDTWGLYARGLGWYPGEKWDEQLLIHRFESPWRVSAPRFLEAAAGKAPKIRDDISYAVSEPTFPLLEFTFDGATIGKLGALCLAPSGDGLLALSSDLAASSFVRRHAMTPIRFANRMIFRPEDYGHPALPLMLIQDTRAQLDRSPADPDLLLALAKAYETIDQSQEEYWANFHGRQAFEAVGQNKDFNRFYGQHQRDVKAGKPRESESQIRQQLEKVFNRNRIHQQLEKVLNPDRPTPPGAIMPTLRKQMRQLQIVAFLKFSSEHQADNLNVQMTLGHHYREHQFLDLALEQYQKALKLLEGLPGTKSPKEREQLKQLQQQIKGELAVMEADVKKRSDKALSALAGIPDGPFKWAGIYGVCLDIPYEWDSPNADEKDRPVDPYGFGLAQLCLDQFKKYPVSSLKAEEVEGFVYFQVDLMLRMGLVREVMEILSQENLKDAQGPLFSRIHAMTQAVLGNYESAQKHLDVLEKFLPPVDLGPLLKDLELKRKDFEIESIAFPANFLLSLPDGPLSFGWFYHLPQFFIEDQKLSSVAQEISARRTVWMEWDVFRGILALEAGNPEKAKKHFQDAVAIAALPPGSVVRASELAIAVRYLDWMARYEKK